MTLNRNKELKNCMVEEMIFNDNTNCGVGIRKCTKQRIMTRNCIIYVCSRVCLCVCEKENCVTANWTRDAKYNWIFGIDCWGFVSISQFSSVSSYNVPRTSLFIHVLFGLYVLTYLNYSTLLLSPDVLNRGCPGFSIAISCVWVNSIYIWYPGLK